MSNWIHREELRMASEYEVTETLQTLNLQYPGYFIHVCKADRQLVAYTQSIEKGERDKQTPIKLGVLMRKLNNLWTDNHISEAVSDHFAELNTTFSLLAGPQVTQNYNENYWGSCMSGEYWRHRKSGQTMDEALGYDVLGNFYDGNTLKLAVVSDGVGRLIGRSVVDELRKVYIRAYGDTQKVTRTLERAGYSLGGYADDLSNPRQYAVSVAHNHGDRGTIYLPYLDHAGRNGECLRACLVEYPDHEYLLAVCVQSGRAAANLDRQGIATGNVTSTSGMVMLPIYPREAFIVDIEDQRIDLLAPGPAASLKTVRIYLGEGKTRLVLEDQLPKAYTRRVYAAIDGTLTPVYITRETNTFYYDEYVDDASTRRLRGYVQLDETLYPDDRAWYTLGGTVIRAEGPDGNDCCFKHEDAVTVLSHNGSDFVAVQRHKSDPRVQPNAVVKLYDKKVVEKAFAHMIVRTNTKAKVLPGVHDVVYASTPEGWQWMFKRSALRVREGGLLWYVPRVGAAGPKPEAEFRQAFAEWLEDPSRSLQSPMWVWAAKNSFCDRWRRSGLRGFRLAVYDDGLYTLDYYGRKSQPLPLTGLVTHLQCYTEGWRIAASILASKIAEMVAVESPVPQSAETVDVPQAVEIPVAELATTVE